MRIRTHTIGIAFILLGMISCNPQTVVTDRWPNGNVQRQASIVEGDTVRLTLFDEEGQLTKSSEWQNGKPHGEWNAFYPNGTRWSEHHYIHGVQIGEYLTWHPNGMPYIQGQYDSIGKPSGDWLFFDEKGKIIKEISGASIHNQP